MENLPTNQSNFGISKTMSSREIAELTEKEHKHVMRDIRTLIEQGAITESNFGLSEYRDASGKSNPEYLLDFNTTMTLLGRYGMSYLKAKKALVNHGLMENNAMTTSIVSTPNHSNFGKSMSSREIAELTGKRHDNVLRDIKILIEQGAIDRLSFEAISYKDTYGREQTAYKLNFDATMTLVTGYNAVLRAKVIRRWRELEEKTHSVALPKTYKEALKALLVEVEAREQLEVQNAQLTAREAENQPKVDFYEAVKKSESTCLVRVLARYLKQNGYDTGQNRLYAWMKNNGYIHKGGRSKNLPTQKSMNAGLFKVKMTEQELPNGDKIVQHTTLVTTKGVQYFVKRLLGKEYDGSITELKAKENSGTENVQNVTCIEDLTWED